MKRTYQGGASPHPKQQLLNCSEDSDSSLPPQLNNFSQSASHSSDSFVEAPLLSSSPYIKFPSQFSDLDDVKSQQSNISASYGLLALEQNHEADLTRV